MQLRHHSKGNEDAMGKDEEDPSISVVQSSISSDSIDARLSAWRLATSTHCAAAEARPHSKPDSRRGCRISQGRCPIHLNGAPEVERRRSNIFPAFYIFKYEAKTGDKQLDH